MLLTVEQLRACGVPPTLAKAFIDPINAAMALHDISTTWRVSCFLAQAFVESTGFLCTTESLLYSSPERIAATFPSRVPSVEAAKHLVLNQELMANTVYAGKNGNGDVVSGDGFRFRGRGLFQLTGRGWYTRAATTLGRPYVDQPELVALPPDAALTAAWYWLGRGCNELADTGSVDAITKAINGAAMLQADRRRALSAEFFSLLQ